MTKKRRLSISTLAFASAASLVTAAALVGGTVYADADRDITLTGENFFYVANDAAVEEYAEGDSYYTAFSFADDDSAVTYRKNLAYHWFSSVKDEEGAPTAAAEEGYLSTEIGFSRLDFETFTIKFQSQQYTQTEDGVTDNYITFITAEDGVFVKIGEALPEEEDARAEEIAEITSEGTALSPQKLAINFTGYDAGAYGVTVSDGTASAEGEFANIGGSYARYVSSNTATSVIPLTYSAQGGAATMVLYSFNGQSFELFGDEGERSVNDDTSPVLCLDGDITSLAYGRTIDIGYTAIDMLATSPKATLNYYVLTEEQLEAGDLNATGEESNFVSVSGSSNISPVIRGNGTYVPEGEDGTGYKTECLVKVYYYLQDTTASSGNTDNVFLDWYVPAEFAATVTAGDGEQYSFIRATDDGEGAVYVQPAEGEVTYQQLVDQAIAEQEATAGDDKYFYLPSFEGYVFDNVTPYTDFEFSVYYISDQSGSATALDYNELSIELAADGLYRFAIYAKDSSGNSMYYIDEEGEKVTFTGSDIEALLKDPAAHGDLAEKVPVFQFTVNYGGLSVTDPEGQEIGYVGTQYNANDFEVSGLSSNYTTTYSLYLFNRQAYTEEVGAISYADFVKLAAELFNDPDSRAAYFTAILSESEVDRGDENYELYSDYAWDPSGLSFVPQEDNSFYVIRMSAKDNIYNTGEIESFMSISVSAAADHIAGENDWLENNVASVVLLCVAGAALIGIVLLVVIKPKEKGDIDLVEEVPAKRVSARKTRDK